MSFFSGNMAECTACGDDLAEIARFIPEGQTSYTAKDVISKLLELES